jgi:hypothetical protein
MTGALYLKVRKKK